MSSAHASASARPSSSPWLVSARWDLAVFGGSAALAFLLLWWGRAHSALERALPVWTWVATVVAVDVAHVWATLFRVYLDPIELRRRPGLYTAIPVGCFVSGVLLYTSSAALFWRVLAYLAVFHFVRQQYGWMALYRRRRPDPRRGDRLLADAAIYSATLYPLLWWHAHLPREFEWFVAGDFLPGLPAGVATTLGPLHLAVLGTYALRQVHKRLRGEPGNPGQDLILGSTALSWWAGIVALDSDYAFTVTNVLVHGIPYLAFVWRYGRTRWPGPAPGVARLFRPGRWPLYLMALWLLAFAEEWGWDRLVWHEHGSLFPGPELFPREALALVVPLLAVPQAAHYLLDAWVWRLRTGANPGLAARLGVG